jgi:hypothetical protein
MPSIKIMHSRMAEAPIASVSLVPGSSRELNTELVKSANPNLVVLN